MNFSHLFQISVFNQQSDIKLDLYSNVKNQWSKDHLVASIITPLPGDEQSNDSIQSSSSSSSSSSSHHQHHQQQHKSSGSRDKATTTLSYAPLSANYSFTTDKKYIIKNNM